MCNCQVVNQTHYHPDTPTEMVQILERIRQDRWRVRFHWGDTSTGKDWGDMYDVAGYLGRSMGPCKSPLLIHNARSLGGPAILDHCIVRVRHANKKDGGDIWKHPDYH